MNDKPFNYEEAKQREIYESMGEALKASMIPARYLSVDWRDVPELGGISSSQSLLLIGPVGVGKTYAACAQLKHYIWDSCNLKNPDELTLFARHLRESECSLQTTSTTSYLVEPTLDLMAYYTDAADYSDKSRLFEYEKTLLRISKATCLVIDDLQRKPTAQELSTMQRLIKKRHEMELPTNITTNLTLEEIEQYYGEAIFSRIKEMFKVIILSGEDRRKAKHD